MIASKLDKNKEQNFKFEEKFDNYSLVLLLDIAYIMCIFT